MHNMTIVPPTENARELKCHHRSAVSQVPASGRAEQSKIARSVLNFSLISPGLSLSLCQIPQSHISFRTHTFHSSLFISKSIRQ